MIPKSVNDPLMLMVASFVTVGFIIKNLLHPQHCGIIQGNIDKNVHVLTITHECPSLTSLNNTGMCLYCIHGLVYLL